jgi:hypothetical protein
MKFRNGECPQPSREKLAPSGHCRLAKLFLSELVVPWLTHFGLPCALSKPLSLTNITAWCKQLGRGRFMINVLVIHPDLSFSKIRASGNRISNQIAASETNLELLKMSSTYISGCFVATRISVLGPMWHLPFCDQSHSYKSPTLQTSCKLPVCCPFAPCVT